MQEWDVSQYKIKGGEFSGKKLYELDAFQVQDFAKWANNKLGEDMKDFVDKVNEYSYNRILEYEKQNGQQRIC